jgi:hypothetical protein
MSKTSKNEGLINNDNQPQVSKELKIDKRYIEDVFSFRDFYDVMDRVDYHHHQLLISEIEEDGVFYCIYDYSTMGRMGQKTRYKFKILNYSDSINISDYQIELLEEKMIMIR